MSSSSQSNEVDRNRFLKGNLKLVDSDFHKTIVALLRLHACHITNVSGAVVNFFRGLKWSMDPHYLHVYHDRLTASIDTPQASSAAEEQFQKCRAWPHSILNQIKLLHLYYQYKTAVRNGKPNSIKIWKQNLGDQFNKAEMWAKAIYVLTPKSKYGLIAMAMMKINPEEFEKWTDEERAAFVLTCSRSLGKTAVDRGVPEEFASWVDCIIDGVLPMQEEFLDYNLQNPSHKDVIVQQYFQKPCSSTSSDFSISYMLGNGIKVHITDTSQSAVFDSLHLHEEEVESVEVFNVTISTHQTEPSAVTFSKAKEFQYLFPLNKPQMISLFEEGKSKIKIKYPNEESKNIFILPQIAFACGLADPKCKKSMFQYGLTTDALILKKEEEVFCRTHYVHDGYCGDYEEVIEKQKEEMKGSKRKRQD